METDPRHLAFYLLHAGQRQKTTLDRAIEEAGERLEQLTRQDRALCNAIVFGVLRHRGRLDHIVRACADRPLERMDPKVLTILRIGLFQLVFLDRVPDFAAIHSSIELAKSRTGKKAAGFINAVLRRAAAEHGALDLPDPKKQFTAFLSAACSIPPWLGKKWAARYGKKATQALGRAMLEIPPLTLRTNTLKTTRQALIRRLMEAGIQARETDHAGQGIEISVPGRPVTELPGFESGLFQVQDEAAQLVTELLAPRPGERILDACSGLGGKTCHMGQLMENQGLILANDPDSGKKKGRDEEALRLGITIIQSRAMDITRARLDDLGGYFDRVLVDAPCTGLGVMRRNPDTRWKRNQKDILRMAALQKKILNCAANLVAPGGVLVYAVCSCESEENEEVIRRFLEKRKDFTPDPQGMAAHLPRFADRTKEGFYFRTHPDLFAMDGFFVARMRRNNRTTKK